MQEKISKANRKLLAGESTNLLFVLSEIISKTDRIFPSDLKESETDLLPRLINLLELDNLIGRQNDSHTAFVLSLPDSDVFPVLTKTERDMKSES